jgi:hypothetical protein
MCPEPPCWWLGGAVVNWAEVRQNMRMDLMARARSDHKPGPIFGKENLLHSVPQAASGAGIHLGFFNDLGPVLHLHTNLRAPILVYRMASAQAAERTLLLLRRSRDASQRQRRNYHGEKGGVRAPLHRGLESTQQPNQETDSLHVVTL